MLDISAFSGPDLPISHCKGKRSTITHPISYVVSYNRFTLFLSICLVFIFSIYTRTYLKAIMNVARNWT